MKSIVLIIPYFGKWPVWFDAHLISIAKNPSIHWFITTDCEIPQHYPQNITFKSTTLSAFNTHINNVLGANVPLTPRKLCDLRPAYSAIFNEDIKDYDFWGICDMDIIWGNIRKYVTPQLLDKYDIISTLEDMVSGHFTLFKNTNKINSLYTKIENYKHIIEESKHMRFDEVGFSNFLKDYKLEKINIFWDKDLLKDGLKSEVHQEYFLDRWIYKNGAIIDLQSPNHKEYMYLHFINWKRTMKRSEVTYSDQPDSFYISYSKIHFQPHNALQKMWNNFTNLFDGYYVRLKKNNFKRKVKKGKNIFKIYKWGK